MKVKNQVIVISGILALLATATIVASYNVQTAKAAQSNFGKIASGQATGGTTGPGGTGGPGLGPHSVTGNPATGSGAVSCVARDFAPGHPQGC